MRKLQYLIAIAIFCFGASQNITAQTKADELLNEVAEKFKKYENVVFTYKGNLNNSASQLDMDLQGEAILSGEKYNVNFLGSTYIFDGNKLYIINREDEQITISSVEDEGNQMITPSNILTFYESGYKKDWDIEQNVRGRMIQYIKLTPIKSNSEYKNVLLGIDKSTKHIYNAIVTEHSGTKATFTLTSLKVNQPLPKTSFSFDRSDYEGWSIDELD